MTRHLYLVQIQVDISSKPCTCQKAPVSHGKRGLGQQISGFARVKVPVTTSAILLSTGSYHPPTNIDLAWPCQIGTGKWVSTKKLASQGQGRSWIDGRVSSETNQKPVYVGRRSTTVKGFSGSLWMRNDVHQEMYEMELCQERGAILDPQKLSSLALNGSFWGQFWPERAVFVQKSQTPESRPLSAIPCEQGHKLGVHLDLSDKPIYPWPISICIPSMVLKLDIYIYTYTYIYMYVHICILYIYVYIYTYVQTTSQFHSITLHTYTIMVYVMLLWLWILNIIM